jgi:hypothetical protein
MASLGKRIGTADDTAVSTRAESTNSHCHRVQWVLKHLLSLIRKKRFVAVHGGEAAGGKTGVVKSISPRWCKAATWIA